MNLTLLRTGLKLRRFGKSVSNAVVGYVTVGLLRLLRHVEFTRLARFTSGVTRTFGPWMSEQRTGRANLTAAFPDKSPAEIEQILINVWDGLGRLGAEFAHMDHIWDFDPARPAPAVSNCRPTRSLASRSCAKTAKAP